MACLLGQFVGMHQVLFEGVKCPQQRRSKTPRGTKARPGRDIGHAGDFQIGGLDPGQFQRFSNERMLHLVDRSDPLQA
jgi:hypothetical protein